MIYKIDISKYTIQIGVASINPIIKMRWREVQNTDRSNRHMVSELLDSRLNCW